MAYLNENFLLNNKTSQRLFHEIAAKQPIMDYHCHLDSAALADNVGFSNLSDMWLGGDHYKWRAMRAAGEPEELITGKDSSPKEKFDAWARTVPQTVRNPLHHWTHLELKSYFKTDLILSPKTADAIWNSPMLGSRRPPSPLRTSAKISTSGWSAQRTIRSTVCSTTSPSIPADTSPKCSRRSAPIKA